MQDAVGAARGVLLELTRILGEYREHMVLVGGWVPDLLLPGARPRHIGSLDIDLALDHRKLTDSGYKTIHDLLTAGGYGKDPIQPFVYKRRVSVKGRSIIVEVDLLAGEYGGTGKSRRTQTVQDVRPRKARGVDLALDMSVEIELTAELPDGGTDSAKVRVASIVPFLVMKGMAIAGRVKEKDAYDIYFCIERYPGGIDALAEAFRPHMSNGLVKEGLSKIASKFTAVDAFGPTSVANFEEATDPGEIDRIRRDAFERVSALLEKLRISPA